MIKVNIDFSIFTQEPKSIGSVSGSINLVAAPNLGDKIWFTVTANNVPFPARGFDGCLTVERRMLNANPINNELLILLSDLVVPTDGDARAVVEYLEEGFGLFVDIHGDD